MCAGYGAVIPDREPRPCCPVRLMQRYPCVWYPNRPVRKSQSCSWTISSRSHLSIIWAYSPRLHAKSYAKPYGGKFPCIIGIKGFSGVLIHPGATKADTEACLLPGMHTSPGRVTDSQKAYKDFMDFYFVPAMKRGDKCYITIE